MYRGMVVIPAILSIGVSAEIYQQVKELTPFTCRVEMQQFNGSMYFTRVE
jgi:hypothetical protein